MDTDWHWAILGEDHNDGQCECHRDHWVSRLCLLQSPELWEWAQLWPERGQHWHTWGSPGGTRWGRIMMMLTCWSILYFILVFQRRNIGLQSFSKSCWAGLEKKFFWLTEQRDFLKKLKVLPYYRSRSNRIHQESTQIVSENQFGNDKETEIAQDVFDIKTLLEKLKLALIQVNSDVSDENEMLKRELISLKGLIQEKDRRIRLLENILLYEKSKHVNTNDVMMN